MFLQLRTLWTQKRELNKTIRSASIFTLTTQKNSNNIQKESLCSTSIIVDENYISKDLGDQDTQKEVKMTLLLLSFVATYVILTVPSNVTLIYWTLYPEAYVSSQAIIYAICLKFVNIWLNF